MMVVMITKTVMMVVTQNTDTNQCFGGDADQVVDDGGNVDRSGGYGGGPMKMVAVVMAAMMNGADDDMRS